MHRKAAVPAMQKLLINKHLRSSFFGLLIFILISYIIFEFYKRFITVYHFDFDCFYYSAKALSLGRDIYQSSPCYIYPPFFAFLLTPISHFNQKSAEAIWMMINIFLIFINLFFGFKIVSYAFQIKYRRWQVMAVFLLAILLTFQSLRWEIIDGQTDLLSLALITFSLYYLQRKPMLSGALLGITAIIKYQSFLFAPLLLFRAQWKAFFGLLIGLLIAVFVPALKIGWRNNLNYLWYALKGLKNSANTNPLAANSAHVPTIFWERNISITNGVVRIFNDHHGSYLPAIVLALAIAICTLSLIWLLFRKNRIAFLWRPADHFDARKEYALTLIEWSTLVIFMLAFSPESTKRHFALLLNVNLFIAVMLVFKTPALKRGVTWALLLLYQFGIAFSFHWPMQNTGNVWDHLGGPGFSLLLALSLIISCGLAYYRDLYCKTQSQFSVDGHYIPRLGIQK
ncbi:MAG: DUF2029 domain-containing protein [Proteobacteria bacterium]|nr:DUF2029 domain-containing protein [Pseudomonadota bacterium]